MAISDCENGNGILGDEIKEQVKTEEGFKMFVTMSLQEIKKCVRENGSDIEELKSWRDKMYGVWWAIVGLGAMVAILGVKVYVK